MLYIYIPGTLNNQFLMDVSIGWFQSISGYIYICRYSSAYHVISNIKKRNSVPTTSFSANVCVHL